MTEGRIYLIRHSVSTGTERRWLYGKADLPLSESGRRLLEELIGAGIYPDARGRLLVSSGLRRADDTLRAIYGEVPFQVEEGLQEMGLGEFECRTDAELREDPRYREWVFDPTGDVPPPGGESFNAFSERVNRAFDGLVRRADRDVIAVCHGGVIASILYRKIGKGGFYDWLPAPARGFEVIMRDGRAAKAVPIAERKREDL